MVCVCVVWCVEATDPTCFRCAHYISILGPENGDDEEKRRIKERLLFVGSLGGRAKVIMRADDDDDADV